jgi:hypothetical protein
MTSDRMIYELQEAVLMLLVTGYKIKLKRKYYQLILLSKILRILYLQSGSIGQKT